MRSCGVQIVGALAMAGTLDLGGHVPRMRHDGGKGGGAGWEVDPGCKFAYICAGVATCLMEPGALQVARYTRPPLPLGVALHQGAEQRKRAESVDNDDHKADESDAKPTEPKWHSVLKNDSKLYDIGPQDAFITACERIARKHPKWLLKDSSAAITQLNTLLPKVHGEPRFVALSALAKVAECDKDASAAFAEAMLPTLPTLSPRETRRSTCWRPPNLSPERFQRWRRRRDGGQTVGKSMKSRGASRSNASRRSFGARPTQAFGMLTHSCASSSRRVPTLADSRRCDRRCSGLAEGASGSGETPESNRGGADAGGEDSAASAVLKHWHSHLPGELARRRHRGGGAVAVHRLGFLGCERRRRKLGRRGAALRTLPTARDSASVNATAAGWLAATCHVVLAVPRSESAYRTPVFDSGPDGLRVSRGVRGHCVAWGFAPDGAAVQLADFPGLRRLGSRRRRRRVAWTSHRRHLAAPRESHGSFEEEGGKRGKGGKGARDARLEGVDRRHVLDAVWRRDAHLARDWKKQPRARVGAGFQRHAGGTAPVAPSGDGVDAGRRRRRRRRHRLRRALLRRRRDPIHLRARCADPGSRSRSRRRAAAGGVRRGTSTGAEAPSSPRPSVAGVTSASAPRNEGTP